MPRKNNTAPKRTFEDLAKDALFDAIALVYLDMPTADAAVRAALDAAYEAGRKLGAR